MAILQQLNYHHSHEPNGELIRRAHKELFLDSEKVHFLSSETDDALLKVHNVANRINDDFENLIIIGAGASINIPKIVFSLPHSSALKIVFLEAMDHRLLHEIFNGLVAEKTAILTISKSGDTPEVMLLLSICVQWLRRRLGANRLKTHLYFVTESNSKIANFAEEIGATSIDHPSKVGGRFSFFYSTGLLQAAIAGFSIEALVASGRDSFSKFLSNDSWMLDGCIYNYSLSRIYSQSVLMYYDPAFEGTMLWLRQMIGESLGKNGKGITPLMSNGMIDRHSQLQLYLDGPNNKYFTLLSYQPEHYDKDDWETIEEPLAKALIEPKMYDLGVRKFNNIQEQAMITTLSQSGKSVRYITTSSLAEDFIGEFVMSQMLEVVIYAYAENINPFDQLAVESFKRNVKEKYKE